MKRSRFGEEQIIGVWPGILYGAASRPKVRSLVNQASKAENPADRFNPAASNTQPTAYRRRLTAAA